MAYKIRPATEQDADAMCALLNPIILAGSMTSMAEPLTSERQLVWMRSLEPRGVLRVAIDSNSGRLLGMQSVEAISKHAEALAHVGDISTFVAQDSARRGIGTALMHEVVPLARNAGFTNILAMIRADNSAALAFYHHHGFRTAGVMREHLRVGDRFVDQVLTELLLD